MKTADTRVYRINTGRLLLIPVLWLMFVTLLLATDAIAVASLLTLILGPMFYFMVWRSRLELNEQGITHFLEALKGGRFIALMPFTNLLGDGPLGRDLARLAPHLFMKVQAADIPDT